MKCDNCDREHKNFRKGVKVRIGDRDGNQENLHFCNKDCLGSWVAPEKPKAKPKAAPRKTTRKVEDQSV